MFRRTCGYTLKELDMNVSMPHARPSQKGRYLLVARYFSIEPLGLVYLAGVIRDAGWECRIVLVHGFEFEPLYDAIREWKPDFVGFQIWTGWHVQTFAACDAVQNMGAPVVIGGPHATYFDTSCGQHAAWVLKAGAFNLTRELLAGRLSPGIHFDKSGREDAFPLPDRDALYKAYPEFGRSPIKSIFGSVGCPMRCTYCYAPTFNEMHGGFKLLARPIDELIAEAHDLMRYPTKMIYFQDDIFGYPPKWVEEFAKRWKREVGLPFHCQIRLELTRKGPGDRRLDLFAEAGCTGITLAIESGNALLRKHVLFRHMEDELIEEGCRKITDRGMTLRTEQILAVPFSDTNTDLATLGLNARINPTMAWTSILAPYQGTNMGTIAQKYGLYTGNNDDLADTFFDRSVLRHVRGGPQAIEHMTRGVSHPKEDILLQLKTHPLSEFMIEVRDEQGVVSVMHLLEDHENERYNEDAVRLQRTFNFLAKVPGAENLGRTLVDLPAPKWTWEEIGRATTTHLLRVHTRETLEGRVRSLAEEMGVAPENLPEPIAQNPHYFCYFPAGGKLAKQVLDLQVFDRGSTAATLDEINTLTRRHLFVHGLYKIETGAPEIATT